MNYETAKTLYANTKYIKWYFLICDNQKKYKGDKNHRHHFLPESLFPEFSDFKTNEWNKITISTRVHFILHYLLYKHYKKIGDIKNAKGNLHAVFNFAKNSKKYERFRKLLSEMVTEKWKDPEFRNKTTKSMSVAAKKKYENEEERNKCRITTNEWHARKDKNEWNLAKEKISKTLSRRIASGEINCKEQYNNWAENNPEAYKKMIENIRATKLSDEYKDKNWILCEHCDTKYAPISYKQFHGEYCSKNENATSRLKICLCCGQSFNNIGQHYRHKPTCKEFNEQSKRHE